MNPYDILKRPVLTEKSYAGIPVKTYTFEVAKDANKIQIKQAVEQIFEVKVEKVNTISMKGKKRVHGRSVGYTPDWKKAVIHLTADSKAIEFFESLS